MAKRVRSVGVSDSANAVRDAAERACVEAGVRRIEIAAAEVGLAGVKRADIRERMRAALKSELGIKSTEVVTDADIALYGATEGKPGLVIIAGTGSICCGVNSRASVMKSNVSPCASDTARNGPNGFAGGNPSISLKNAADACASRE